MMKTFKTMFKTELKLSLRDMNMILFAIIMPVVIQIILGMIYKNQPAFEGADYTFMEQSFGALCTIAICAGGVMGLPILVSDYRERKVLKRLKVTPISPAMILFVHLVIYTLYAFVSMILLAVIGVLFYGYHIRGSILVFAGIWLLVLVSILSIGMFVGGIAKNSQKASLIACILYFPMLIFSGATLPYEVMPKIMQKIVSIMPMTQGIKILKVASLGLEMEDVVPSVIVSLGIAFVFIALSIKMFRWE